MKNPVRVAEGQALQQLEEVTLGMQALINHLKASVLGKIRGVHSTLVSEEGELSS